MIQFWRQGWSVDESEKMVINLADTKNELSSYCLNPATALYSYGNHCMTTVIVNIKGRRERGRQEGI